MGMNVFFRCIVDDRARANIRVAADSYDIDVGTMVERLNRWYLECADTMEGTTDKPRSLDDLKKLWAKIFVEVK